jgi:hypothetical protein
MPEERRPGVHPLEKYLELGKRFGDAGDYKSALLTYEAAMLQYSDNVDLIFEVASFCGRHGIHDQAISLYQKFLGLRPDDPRAMNDLALVYLLTERAQEAVSLLEKVVAISQDQSIKLKGILNLGYAYGMVGQEERANRCFTGALRVEITQPIAHFALGFTADKKEGGMLCAHISKGDYLIIYPRLLFSFSRTVPYKVQCIGCSPDPPNVITTTLPAQIDVEFLQNEFPVICGKPAAIGFIGFAGTISGLERAEMAIITLRAPRAVLVTQRREFARAPFTDLIKEVIIVDPQTGKETRMRRPHFSEVNCSAGGCFVTFRKPPEDLSNVKFLLQLPGKEPDVLNSRFVRKDPDGKSFGFLFEDLQADFRDEVCRIITQHFLLLRRRGLV